MIDVLDPDHPHLLIVHDTVSNRRQTIEGNFADLAKAAWKLDVEHGVEFRLIPDPAADGEEGELL